MNKPHIRWGKRDEPRITFLMENYPHMTVRQLTAAFNERFGLSASDEAVGYQLHVHRILKTPAPSSQES
jgi:hypothetical protein